MKTYSQCVKEFIAVHNSGARGDWSPINTLEAMAIGLFATWLDELRDPTLTRSMPQGARATRCPACGWTFGTHHPECATQKTG